MFEDPRRQRQLEQLVQKLGLPLDSPIDWSLLDLALTHPSISSTVNYQQLEFLGDAVVRLIAAEILLETYPDELVGEFAAIRSIIVSDRFLAELAEHYGLENYIVMTDTIRGNPVGKQSWLADSFESILGALYLSTHNMDLIRPWLDRMLLDKAEEVRQDPARENYKDALQEWTQGKHKVLPEYRVKENPDLSSFEERFLASVWLGDRLLGEGSGASKKSAQQAAAKKAFLLIHNKDD